jgi:Na+-transporting NADH:ubiquinone oxidoreductase subunit NqrF
MADSAQVLAFLRPQGGYIQIGGSYEGIEFIDCEPFTKQEYEAAFQQYDAWKANQEAEAQAKRQAALAKLEALGLDEDDLKALGF